MTSVLRFPLSRLLWAIATLFAGALHAAAPAPAPFPLVPREELRAAMDAYFGPGPKAADAVAPNLEVIDKHDAGDHERWRVRYNVDRDERIDAFLLVPKSLRPGERRPLVLCPHPTADVGKNRVLGIYDEPATDAIEAARRERSAYARDLVARGFVTFAPDRAGYGERRPLPEGNYQVQMAEAGRRLQARYPGWRLTAGKNVWDLQRALDALVTLDCVDPQRIGTIGHSLGAWDSIMIVGMDDRVKAAVINSGGMVHFKPELWSDAAALRRYLDDKPQQGLRENANIWLMLAAPRPVLYLWSLQDAYERGNPNILEGLRTVTAAYKSASGKAAKGAAKADLGIYFHPHGHDFPPEARELAYRWLEERLGPVVKR